ncbi:MAG: HEPN domain-containing protein [Chloroflexi bacterium]|jgi:HEPN domain-containing protein|nr:HEPN domain-containing protein [Chloroflexota bacterium]
MSDELDFDVQGQIEYWRGLVDKDLTIAENLISRDGETAYGLFFVHMALEKIIKAHVVKQTRAFPPKKHNLMSLAELGNLGLSKEQADFCGKINAYNIEARYPGVFAEKLTVEKASQYLAYAKELTAWLTAQL